MVQGHGTSLKPLPQQLQGREGDCSRQSQRSGCLLATHRDAHAKLTALEWTEAPANAGKPLRPSINHQPQGARVTWRRCCAAIHGSINLMTSMHPAPTANPTEHGLAIHRQRAFAPSLMTVSPAFECAVAAQATSRT